MTANIMAATSALPQVLSSGFLPAVDTVLYTCPASSCAKLANASISNVSAADAVVSFSIARAGQAVDTSHRVVQNYTIVAGDTLPLRDLVAGHVLGPGDYISGGSSTANAVTVVISGTVFS